MGCSKKTVITRRDFVRTLVAASAGTILPTSLSGASEPVRGTFDFEPVRQRILEAVARGRATGVAVAVAQGGRIVWEEGFGWANREAGLKATAHTPFSLASITKPFTTTTLMTLVAEGKLSLDDPANKYLQNSKIMGPNGNPEEATLRRLGAHASGLPSMFEHFFRNKSAQAPDAETLLHEYGRLAYPPGSCYEYGNIGYSALGAVTSNVTGMDFGALMTRRVLEPLELRNSFFGANAARLETSAVGYDDSGNRIPYYTTSTPPSGELYASAHDLARFAMFNLKNDLGSHSRILDARWIDDLHQPVFTGPSDTATTFGWFSARTKSGLQTIFKSGGQPGVATILRMVPSENLAALVLTNRSDGSEFAFSVCDQMLKTILPQWTQPGENVSPPRTAFVATPEFLGVWEGKLWNGGADMRARLEIKSSDTATLALADKPAVTIGEMQSEGTALTGKTVGIIQSTDARRNEATDLSLKLTRENGKLVGRILAIAKKPGTLLPYVLSLNRNAN
jgi:CubicO group peptidase (beta-lactamase class C family)